jgi:hypothetical protein
LVRQVASLLPESWANRESITLSPDIMEFVGKDFVDRRRHCQTLTSDESSVVVCSFRTPEKLENL